jgi:signal transduction histidine kinase
MVDDCGPGVPTDERTSIFGRFHRGSAQPGSDQPKGTGLGLSLVDEYVRLEHGRVWVEDAPTGGARFVVEIPERP